MNIALLIAGGVGKRMGQEIPKQFINVLDKPVIIYTLEAFQQNQNIDVIAVVCLNQWEHVLEVYARQFNITKLKHILKAEIVDRLPSEMVFLAWKNCMEKIRLY